MNEHDNDTCPNLVRASLLEAENTRLKADAQLVVKHLGEACADNLRLKADVVELADALKLASEVGIKVADEVTRLKAEVERLRASSFVTAVPVEEYEKLKAEVENLRKSADISPPQSPQE